MLVTNKTVNLTGQSKINEQQVVYMSASVAQGATAPSIVTTITDKELYTANKSECRADIAEFTNMFYDIQDEILGGATE
jgi:hypothetical protein